MAGVAETDRKQITALEPPNRTGVILNSPGWVGQRLRCVWGVYIAYRSYTALRAAIFAIPLAHCICAAAPAAMCQTMPLFGVHQHFFGESTLLPAFVAVENIQQRTGRGHDYLDSDGNRGTRWSCQARIGLPPPIEIYLLLPRRGVTAIALWKTPTQAKIYPLSQASCAYLTGRR